MENAQNLILKKTKFLVVNADVSSEVFVDDLVRQVECFNHLGEAKEKRTGPGGDQIKNSNQPENHWLLALQVVEPTYHNQNKEKQNTG